MHCTRKLNDTISWVGGNDRRLALFENLFPIPRGVSYNSYLITDEKTALIDTVDASISHQFLENIYYVLDGRPLDYLVINHMEPHHCANIEELLLRFPDLKIVGNAKTLAFAKQFYDMDMEGKTITVKENDSISLGAHTLRFYFAPMVHWPEVMVTYEESEKILFSADAFGSFGALNGHLFSDEVDFDKDWLPDARRYYSNIVGKYGVQVTSALKKLSGLDIRMICPLHGPVWRENLEYLLDKYAHWSSYQPEEKAVAVFYASMYGDTENAADILAAGLAEAGVRNLAVYDISNTHVSTLIAEAFRCSHLVIASPTYNGGIYPAALNLLHDMKALNLQNRTIGLIENGTWAPTSTKQMRALLEEMKQMKLLEPAVTIKSALKGDSMEKLEELKESILASLQSVSE